MISVRDSRRLIETILCERSHFLVIVILFRVLDLMKSGNFSYHQNFSPSEKSPTTSKKVSPYVIQSGSRGTRCAIGVSRLYLSGLDRMSVMI